MKPARSLMLWIILLQACSRGPADSAASATNDNGNISQTKSEEKFASVVSGIPVLELPHRFAYWLNRTPAITDSVTAKWCAQIWDSHSRNVWGRVFVDQPNIHLLATQPDDQGTAFLLTFDRSG